MTLNPFFLQGSAREQFLVQDLINEQLKIYGIEVYYLPRRFLNIDKVLREVQSSQFSDNFIIEAYLDNYEGYAPGSDIMTKFGLRLKNEINLVISRERFEEFISPFLTAIQEGIGSGYYPNEEASITSRPREGDLIYFPLGERLFEIKRVEAEKPFYQLGKTYVYELLCELYEYENEDINTTIEEIDNTVQDEGYITTLTLEPIGTSGIATATLGGVGMIGEIILNDDGYNYTSTPTVTISASPTGNSEDNATAVAITTSVGGVKSIESIRITDPGFGYTSTNPPTVTITGGNGVGAAATATVVNNGVRSFTLSNVGSGYYTEPVVTISGPSVGQTATARVVLSGSGTISSLQLTNAGYGYTEAPTVTITGISTVGVGTYTIGETVTGSLSGTTARIKDISVVSGITTVTKLFVGSNSGQFSPGETIVGAASSAAYILSSYDNNSYEESYDINEEIETEADNILDFTESNPFGEY